VFRQQAAFIVTTFCFTANLHEALFFKVLFEKLARRRAIATIKDLPT